MSTEERCVLVSPTVGTLTLLCSVADDLSPRTTWHNLVVRVGEPLPFEITTMGTVTRPVLMAVLDSEKKEPQLVYPFTVESHAFDTKPISSFTGIRLVMLRLLETAQASTEKETPLGVSWAVDWHLVLFDVVLLHDLPTP